MNKFMFLCWRPNGAIVFGPRQNSGGDYETLNTHEIVTGGRNPEPGAKLVRRKCEPGAKEVGYLYRCDKGSEDLDNSD